VAQGGAVNALAQVVLKLTCPGVPDFYQGSELWDFSLVDPDNRRPVDFARRQQGLASLDAAAPGELLAHWCDGRIKMFTIHCLLEFRRRHPALFARGTYTGLAAQGTFAEKVIAFERRHEGEALVVIVPRQATGLGFPPIGAAWQDTALTLPMAGPWEDLCTGREHAEALLPLAAAFAELPFAVLALKNAPA
jgi:(1->4)-alpha-D-glucan 1-alpha-D-glucosylmutase